MIFYTESNSYVAEDMQAIAVELGFTGTYRNNMSRKDMYVMLLIFSEDEGVIPKFAIRSTDEFEELRKKSPVEYLDRGTFSDLMTEKKFREMFLKERLARQK
jgi:hypothetical protein